MKNNQQQQPNMKSSPAQQESLALHRMSKDEIQELLFRYKISDPHQKQQMRDTIEGLTTHIQQIQQRQQLAAMNKLVDQKQGLYQLQQQLQQQQATDRNGAASSYTTPPPPPLIFENEQSPLKAFASTSSISPSVALPVPSSKAVATPRRHHPYAVSGAYSSRIRTRNQALKMLSTLQPSFKLVQTKGGFKIEAFVAYEEIETFHAPEYSEAEYEEQETFYASFKKLSPEEQAVKYKEKFTTRSEVMAIWDTIKPRLLSKLCNQFKDIDSDTIDNILTEHQSYELAVEALTDINLK